MSDLCALRRPEGLARGLVEGAAARALRRALAEFGGASGVEEGEALGREEAARTWEVEVRETSDRKQCRVFVGSEEGRIRLRSVLDASAHIIVGVEGEEIVVEGEGTDAVWGLIGIAERRAIIAEAVEGQDVSDGSKLFGLMRRIEGRLRKVVQKSAKWAVDVSRGDPKRLWEIMQGSPPDARESVLWAKYVVGERTKSDEPAVSKLLKESIAPGETDAEVMSALDDGRAALLCWRVPRRGYVGNNILPGWESVDLALLCTSLERMPGLYCRSDAVEKSVDVAGNRGVQPPLKGAAPSLRLVRHSLSHGIRLEESTVRSHLGTIYESIDTILTAFRAGAGPERDLKPELSALSALLPHLTFEAFSCPMDGELERLARGLLVEADRQATFRAESKEFFAESREAHRELLRRFPPSSLPPAACTLSLPSPLPRIDPRGLRITEDMWNVRDEMGRAVAVGGLESADARSILVRCDSLINLSITSDSTPITSFSLFDCRNSTILFTPYLTIKDEEPQMTGVALIGGAVVGAVHVKFHADWGLCYPHWLFRHVRERVAEESMVDLMTLNFKVDISELTRVPKVCSTGDDDMGDGMISSGSWTKLKLLPSVILNHYEDGVCIEGPPGVGKSTLLQSIALAWGKSGGEVDRMEEEETMKEDAGDKRFLQLKDFDLVLLFPLNEYEHKEELHVEDFWSRALARDNIRRDIVRNALCKGGLKVLYLFDAFDEMESEHRKFFLRFIHSTTHDPTNENFVVFTSRHLSYLPRTISRASVRGFADIDQRNFIHWYMRRVVVPTHHSPSHLGRRRDEDRVQGGEHWSGGGGEGDGGGGEGGGGAGEWGGGESDGEDAGGESGEGVEGSGSGHGVEEAEYLLRHLEKHHFLKEVARAPLMLEFMCSAAIDIANRDEILCGQVTPIYEHAVTLMLNRWERKRNIMLTSTPVSQGQLREALEEVAMFAWNKRRMSHKSAGEPTRISIAWVEEMNLDRNVWNEAHEYSGFLRKLRFGEPSVAFQHKTLGEFLLASAFTKASTKALRGKSAAEVASSVGTAPFLAALRRHFRETDPLREFVLGTMALSRPSGAQSKKVVEQWLSGGYEYMWTFLVHFLTKAAGRRMGGLEDVTPDALFSFVACVCQRLAWRLGVRPGRQALESHEASATWVRLLNELILQDRARDARLGRRIEEFLPPLYDITSVMFEASRADAQSLMIHCARPNRELWIRTNDDGDLLQFAVRMGHLHQALLIINSIQKTKLSLHSKQFSYSVLFLITSGMKGEPKAKHVAIALLDLLQYRLDFVWRGNASRPTPSINVRLSQLLRPTFPMTMQQILRASLDASKELWRTVKEVYVRDCHWTSKGRDIVEIERLGCKVIDH